VLGACLRYRWEAWEAGRRTSFYIPFYIFICWSAQDTNISQVPPNLPPVTHCLMGLLLYGQPLIYTISCIHFSASFLFSGEGRDWKRRRRVEDAWMCSDYACIPFSVILISTIY